MRGNGGAGGGDTARDGASRGPAGKADVDVGLLLRELAPAFSRLGPLLSECAPFFPLFVASSLRVAAALAPFTPAIQATIPALAECTGLVAQNLADQLPRVRPQLYPLGQDVGAAVVALWPLLVPGGELVVAASHLAVATMALADGLGPVLARFVPAPAPAMAVAGSRLGAVAEGVRAGITSGLRNAPLAGPVGQVRVGALTRSQSVLVWAVGSVSRLLPALALPAQAGAIRVLLVVLPVISPVTGCTAGILTRCAPSFVPVACHGVQLATAFTDRLTGVVVTASRASEAVASETAGAPSARPRMAEPPAARGAGSVRQQAPMINIVINVNMRP
jgi:hypothetical protein